MDKVKDILTKYWVGILCGVIALIAIIAAYVPLGGYHEELAGKLKSSAGTYTQLNTLMTATRYKPKTLDQAEQEQLAVFPSQSIIDSGKKLVEKLESESKSAMAAVVEKNQKKPLVANAFRGGGAGYDFRDAYNKRLDPVHGTLITEVLKATMPPTADEIKVEADRRWREDYVPRLIPDAAGTGNPLNKDMIETEYRTAMEQLPNQMRAQRAQRAKVYMAPGTLLVDKTVSDKLLPPPRPEVMWWAQMALWVQEDIAAAIAQANKDAANVTQSRVKRILMVNVPIGPQMIFGKQLANPTGGGMMAPAPDAAVAPQPGSNPNDPVVLDYKTTPSGRTSGGLYDVVQYQVELIVSAKDLPAVLSSFSDNRLVTVLNVQQMWAEDGAAAAKEGFMYGPDPVVRVTMRCEALFLREWTVPMMPKPVKDVLGIPQPPPGTP
jgi:hypothetical protein